jgi:hypothetical protein
MIGRTISVTAFLVSVGWAATCLAEGALVIAMPDGDPNRGFRWSVKVNNPNALSEAMASCQSDNRIAAYCTLVRRFSDQCVAVSVNGGPADSVSATGWAFAADSVAATRDAIAQCEAKRNGRGIACVLDRGPQSGLYCDGTAR